MSFGLKMFHDIHVRIGIVQEDAADVEKLLSCKWCGDFFGTWTQRKAQIRRKVS